MVCIQSKSAFCSSMRSEHVGILPSSKAEACSPVIRCVQQRCGGLRSNTDAVITPALSTGSDHGPHRHRHSPRGARNHVQLGTARPVHSQDFFQPTQSALFGEKVANIKGIRTCLSTPARRIAFFVSNQANAPNRVQVRYGAMRKCRARPLRYFAIIISTMS